MNFYGLEFIHLSPKKEMQHMAHEITDTNFQSEVLESDVPVLVDFWAPWCGPCRMLTPILEKMAETLGERAKIAKVNVDDNPTIASQYGITSIPTVIVFNKGSVAEQFVGVQTESTYMDTLNKLIAS
jgi:thioredoxin 1